ncbi:M23 family metallopeptidase [Aureimonas psammosilenae]|uniref:M23 family metallopeptidase n=1 Tax=Aureimonas psammosilenae TaxID=2495496 RepID=UPI001260E4F3|nr:M23 family metallopeptidase [Aureimonas psammosilenae]
MASGPDALDPFCGHATYDTHDGVDIRVPSMNDAEKGVAVVAMADGRVLRLRDGEPERLLKSDERKLVAGKECGNGLVIDHGAGWSVQYCHLKQGSVAVQPGQSVRRGDKIGLIGASGLVQFPHVHVTVRQNEVAVDPMSGRKVGSGCSPQMTDRDGLWSDDALVWLSKARRHIIDAGLTGAGFDYDGLVQNGAPEGLNAGQGQILSWGWFADLEAGDQIRIRLEAPDGQTLIDHTSDGLIAPRAVHSQIAGRHRTVEPGTYRWQVSLLRKGAVIESRSQSQVVE